MTADHPHLLQLDRDECLRLLASDSIGRVAIVDGGHPVIFPVNYALDGEDVVFRTDPGTKLRAGPRGAGCFEVDQIDRATRTGWSVVVRGRIEEVTEQAADWERLHTLEVDPWAGGEKAHWLRLLGERITGRRLA